NQIPHDEEITRQIEPADQVELALDLLLGALGQRPRAIAPARAALAERAKEADGCLAPRQRIFGESVAEILEREPEPQRQLAGVRHRFRAVGEQALHRSAALHVVLA